MLPHSEPVTDASNHHNSQINLKSETDANNIKVFQESFNAAQEGLAARFN